MKYQYTSKHGEFKIKNPEMTSYLYFPIANEAGVMSSITPDLAGDSKMGQNTFLMPPSSCENLHNDKASRNVWCKVNQKEVISLTGKSAKQQSNLFSENKDESQLEAGFMNQALTRIHKETGVKSVITSFVPATEETIELMKVVIENVTDETMSVQAVVAIPIYGRSADNIRDHRHVTALLNRITSTTRGVMVNPTMTFDERGHQQNEIVYGVFGGNGSEEPIGFYPTIEGFIGEGGNLEQPKALYESPLMPLKSVEVEDGYEALGGLCFKERELESGEKITYVIVLGYGKSVEELTNYAKNYQMEKAFDKALEETKSYWKQKVNVTYSTSDKEFDQWMKWVSFQPMLRRIYGCSFLPHHDYGKGGRGWRDLWQDCLALLIMNPSGVRGMLLDNFGGVRIDGTNATIIGRNQGEFVADRNNITRVWMDHGVWPFLTTNLYIQQTGDIQILLEKNNYFKDLQVCRGEKKDTQWNPGQGQLLKCESGEVYQGTILEHLLVQNLTSFYDVGTHNHIRMRGADWNDALDMADANGESVAFTTMYAQNLAQIGDLLSHLKESGIDTITVFKELEMLLKNTDALYDSIKEKQALLDSYCEACIHNISGEVVDLEITELVTNLKEKGEWIKQHIRETEWIEAEDGNGWFNGYYDNSKNPVECDSKDMTRMMLTSQVFAIMSETASKEQIEKIVASADQHLYDREVGGYKLNTNFNEVKMDLGRMFGFAYGHKENGAVFSHMTTMFGNALYTRGASKEAYKVINTLYSHCNNFEKSKIFPGVPEYIDRKGRGMYHYLTGAASWLLTTVITQMYGIRGEMGDLTFYPQLLKEQFNESKEVVLEMEFLEKTICVIYRNEKMKEVDEYRVSQIILNGEIYTSESNKIMKTDFEQLAKNQKHVIEIILN